jgi:hypothetical protein
LPWEDQAPTEITIRHLVQHIGIVVLLGGYIVSGAFGPGSTLAKVVGVHAKFAFNLEHKKGSFPEEPNVWGTRRHMAPELMKKLKTDVVLLSGLVPEYKEYHVVVETFCFSLPTSSSHYTPRPRDPPQA